MLGPFAHTVACCCVLLGVAAQNLKPVKILATCKRMQQLTTLLRQQCWELLLPFAHSLTYVAFVSISFAPFHPIPSRTSRTSTTWLRVDRNGCYACHPGYWTPGGGGALGYFLGGYVPPGTPNWHPVLKKISLQIDTPF